MSMRAALKGAIITVIVIEVVRWIAENFLKILAICGFSLFLSYALWPFINDDANKSEMKDAIDHMNIMMVSRDSDTAILTYRNNTQFAMNNVIFTCEGWRSIPMRMGPFETIRTQIPQPSNCRVDYSPEQVIRYRLDQIAYSYAVNRDGEAK